MNTMTVETTEALEEVSGLMLQALRHKLQPLEAREAGSREYDSWAGAIEYDSWAPSA